MNKGKIFISLVVLVCSFFPAHSQVKGWVNPEGGTGNDYGNAVAVDPLGNTYVTGKFEGTADFDPSANTAAITSNGNSDIFIAKYDANGNYLWSFGIGSFAADAGNALSIDMDGNIIVTGSFQGIVDFDPSANTYNITGGAYDDIFFAKYNPSGNLIWAKNIYGWGYDFGYAIHSGQNNSVIVAGRFSKSADFDPSANTVNINSVNNSIDGFIAKYDSAGNLIWVKNIGGNNSDWFYDFTLDNDDNIYLTGVFSDTTDFDASAGTTNLISNGQLDFFAVKYDSAGNFIWAEGYGGVSDDFGNSIDIDEDNNIYLLGQITDTIDADPSVSDSFIIPNGGADISIASYDENGNFRWGFGIGGTSFDYAKDIAVSSSGKIYATGSFFGTADFDPSGNIAELTSSGTDIFIASFNTNGNYLWAKNLGGANEQTSNSIITDYNKNIYFTGYFFTAADFEGSMFNSSGSADIFIAKYNDTFCVNTSNSITWTSCGYYILNGTTYDSSGTYFQTLANAEGCDSIITLNLTINTIDTSVNESGNILTSNTAGAVYQWLDCNNGFAVISGQFNQTFIAAANGAYAVYVVQNGCSDTSACHSITGLTLLERKSDNSTIIFPNPSSGFINISFKNIHPEKTEITIYNLLGQNVYRLEKNISPNENMPVAIDKLPEGVYAVQIRGSEKSLTYKFIKD